jgi:uncharacterized metal-binding protein YceD (DUF177 family)
MDQPFPIAWTIDCTDLPEVGRAVRFEADAVVRARLAEHAGVLRIDALSAEGEVRPWAGGVEARLRLVADVVQACVVTLEPVPQHISERLVRRFLPAAHLGEGVREVAVEIAPDEEDPPEPFDGRAIDLGPALAEELVLALDPYPRAPGAAVPPEAAEAGAEPTPFAVLKALKETD